MIDRADTTVSCPRFPPQQTTRRRIARRTIAVALAVLSTAAAPLPRTQPALAVPAAIIWQSALAAAPAFGPAFDASQLYVALRDDTIVAVNHVTGASAWTVPRATTVQPVVTEGLVIGAEGTVIWALDGATGTQRWQQDLGAGAVLAPVATRAGVLWITDRQECVLVAASDGSVKWRAPLGAAATAVPAVSGDAAWTGFADGRVLALQLSTGKTLWTQRVLGAVRILTGSGDRVVVGTSADFLFVLARADGSLAFQWRTGGDVVAGAAVDERRMYFVSMDNTLRSLDRQHGDIRWQTSLPTRSAGGPVVSGNAVMIAGVSPELRIFHAKDGAALATILLPGRAAQQPYIAGADGAVGVRAILVTIGGQIVAIGEVGDPPLVPFGESMGRGAAPTAVFADLADPPLVPFAASLGPGAAPGAVFADLKDPFLEPLDFLPGRRLAPETLPALR